MAIEVGEITGEPAIVVWPMMDAETGERYWTWRIVTTALLSQGDAKHATPQHAFAEAMSNLNQHIEEHNLRLKAELIRDATGSGLTGFPFRRGCVYCAGWTMWWLSFTDGSVVIIAASSLTHARLLAAAKGLGRASHFVEGNPIDTQRFPHIPQEFTGKTLSPVDARQLLEILNRPRSIESKAKKR